MRRAASAFTSIFLLLATLVPATASPSAHVSVSVTGGPLALGIVGTSRLDAVNLNGLDQTTFGKLATVDLRDPRGTGSGWHVNISASDFTNISKSEQAIPAGGFSIPSPPTITTAAGNSSPAAFAGPLGSPLTLLSANPGTGMGRYQTNPDLSLIVPAGTMAGTYESTVTLTISSGP